ncbi:zinc-ribbon domain containing protein [Pseudomarimonas arenosa]|uniref:zinc-ribbon domain containing protein n=1 Tax=Pseudomarimonas arenosa TaxID=2774145 RepID=UPI003CCDF5C3
MPECYRPLPYICRGCGCDCVFSAEDQKYAREVLKKRLEWGPSLCDDCYAVRVGLERERDRFIAAWRERRSEVLGDSAALQRWLEVLEMLPRYGPRKDSAKISQLRKLLVRL